MVLSMGVFDRLKRTIEHFHRLGFLVYKTEWRSTRAGARTYEFLIDPETGKTLEYDIVPSTFGTHPHVVFALRPDMHEVLRITYNRSSRGAENTLWIEKCRVEKNGHDYGDVVLSCTTITEVTLDRDEELDEAIVRRLGEELVKTFRKFNIELG